MFRIEHNAKHHLTNSGGDTLVPTREWADMSTLFWNVVLWLVVLYAAYTVWRMGNATGPMMASSATSSTKVATTTGTAMTSANSIAVAKPVTAPAKAAKP
jgi:hypothetical protein